MNTLAFGLLSLIALTPCTGYDLTQRIQLFWNANHSQVYPLLGRLEETGYVRHEHVVQADKPDKKIYTITDAGLAALRTWIAEPTDPPVSRDEFSLKMFSVSLTDKGAAVRLLQERETYLMNKLERLERRTQEIRQRAGIADPATDATDDPMPIPWPSPYFGASLLIEKSQAVHSADLEWCRRMLRMLQETY